MIMKCKHIKICEMQLKWYLKGKFIALNVYITKGERSNINDLSFPFKKSGKKEEEIIPMEKEKEIIKGRNQ